MVCNKCGAQMSDTAKFCNRCGEPAGEKAVSKKTNKKASEKVVSKKTNKKAGKKPIVISVVALSLIMVLIIVGPMVMKSIESMKTKNQEKKSLVTNVASVHVKDLIYEYNESDMTAKVTGIGAYEIVIPSNVEVNGKVYTVTSIGDSAFKDSELLKNILIPDSVINIEDKAFMGCKNLESVIIPDSVKSIGQSAFQRCNSIRSIAIPESVIEIKYMAFGDCANLESIVVPEDAEGYRVFWGCDKLSEEDIPENLR